ncbi:IMP dehydrogenase [Candidatus Woesearchaeota archaeon]|nr:IMP dehydrogenase [Candidatus Woesearchaeota archaeon]
MKILDKQSGLSAEDLFKKGEGIVYDDFTILDTNFSDIDKKDINLETDLGKGIILKTPIIAAPMDTVTNAALCITIALQGGIGCIHYNFKKPDGSPDIDRQIREIAEVKRFENGFIENPVAVSPDYNIEQAIKIGEKNIIGKNKINNFPVTEDGTSHGKLIGFLRKEDYSRTKKLDLKVKERMVPLSELTTAEWPITLEEANAKLWEKHLSFLCIVDKKGNLMYLVTRKDLDKNEEYPLATKDKKKRLRVLFAVETRPDIAYERLKKGFTAGADGCVIDTSQGFTRYEFEMVKYIQENYPDKLIIGGNISSPEAYKELNKLGTDACRCGQGSGSICTTAGAIGISRAGAAGVYNCAKQKGDMKTIADGGLKQVGDIMKALTIGAHAVMLGNMLAGTEESPGETILDSESGLPVKIYRGMGSKEANTSGIRGYSRLPQGVSGHVKYRGSVHEWVPLIRDGLYSALHTLNCKNIQELHEKTYSGKVRFEKRTEDAKKESRVHNLTRWDG